MGERLSELRARIPMNAGVQNFFDGLEESEREQLAALVHDALARQDRRIDQAGEDALRIVPRVFRGPVKRMLFGEQD